MKDGDIWHHIFRLGGKGILWPRDIRSLNDAKQKLFALMSDGKWHSRIEITSCCEQLEATRRLRELRDLPGVTIERRPLDGRLFEYKMAIDPSVKPVLDDEKGRLLAYEQGSLFA